MKNISEILKSNPYPGRGIILGKSPDGKAVAAYFIMGRSENSRNRVFVENEFAGISTKAFDESKMSDPSLVIYNAVRVLGSKLIVTNGDQTDTIAELMDKQQTFEQSLRTREYEPDRPNFTPRISGILHFSNSADNSFNYAMSILKCDCATISSGNNPSCLRYTFAYNNPKSGTGRFIHTYKATTDPGGKPDNLPLPSFEGEPVPIEISGNIDDFASLIWDSLDSENKVSLWVRFVDVGTGAVESRIVNKYE
ncbi:MAG: IMP cyclohydrolase [Oscillospiraceae bacterium]|nr:IMP cyclohydrolase [Oscillospiraceae bacterium]